MNAQAGLLLERFVRVAVLLAQGEAPEAAWKRDLDDGVTAYEHAQYPQAERFLLAAQRVAEGFGPEDLRLAQSLHALGKVYFAQGREAQAESLYERSLQIREKVLGPNDPQVAQSLHSLGSAYLAEALIGQAESLYRRALALREIALGPEHADVAQSLCGLGQIYYSHGPMPQAEAFYQRCLARSSSSRKGLSR